MGNLVDKVLSFLAPFECLGCQREGRLLCSVCKELLLPIPERCYRCRKISSDSLTCPKCHKTSKLRAVYVAVVYEGLSKELVWRLKYGSAKAASKEVAKMMIESLSCLKNVFIVPVPTTTKRARQRGYDQAKLIAKELSKQTRLPYLDCVSRHGSVHQVGASRFIRKKQLKDAFHINNPKVLQNQHILLIDDVLTTGATLEAAANALKKAGAKRVSAAVFAQTE